MQNSPHLTKTVGLPSSSKANSSKAKEKPFTPTEETRSLIQREMRRYETKLSCLLPCLWQIQKQEGWVPPSAVPYLNQATGIPSAHIFEVLMFYTLFNKKPVGRFHVQICGNLSCALRGSPQMIQKLCQAFNSKEGELSPCGRLTISKVECLGACDAAPVLQLNERYIGKATAQKLIAFLKSEMRKSPKPE